MVCQATVAYESFVAKFALISFWLVGLTFGPLFSAPHQSLLGGIPLDVVLETNRMAEICLARGAVEKCQSLVFG